MLVPMRRATNVVRMSYNIAAVVAAAVIVKSAARKRAPARGYIIIAKVCALLCALVVLAGEPPRARSRITFTNIYIKTAKK